MAAVLACRSSAILSHRSAAALWRVVPATDVIEVTVRGAGGRRRRHGAIVYRSTTLERGDRAVRSGIPVTTPARTLRDLRQVLPRKGFAAALREAEFLRLPIGDAFATDHTRTELESRLLRICRRHRLPPPEVNVRLGRWVVDFLWRGARLVVEVDGWESHRTRSAFEQDRARDAGLKVVGYEVLRFTWRQVNSDPARVAGTIRAILCR